MNFFRRKKAESTSQPAPKVPAQGHPDNNRGNGQNKPGNTPYQVISKKDAIPIHSAVLSIKDGPLELNLDLQKNYAILLTDKEKKEVEVICSIEVVRRTGLDADYLAIVDRIKRMGFVRSRSKLIAHTEIIQIIYEQTEQRRSLEDQQKTATKIQIEFDELLSRAVEEGASDIHIEVRKETARVRFRKNGDLYEFAPWPVRYARVMAGVIYMVIADEKDTSFDETRPQSAIIDRDLGKGTNVRVRLNTLPAYPAGFDMIMRLLRMGQEGKKKSLDGLGYNKEQLTKTRRAVAKPVGALIMAGTTGSGKSTSLNAMLAEKIAAYGGRLKVITVEDPPEYLLDNATQVPVIRSRTAGKDGDTNPFASTVRATMRSDPDILMVGEVRDPASAELLIHAVQSGHQVYTTTHAPDGIGIIARLRSNLIPDDVLGGQGFISGLMYQTLLPVVCTHCSNTIQEYKHKVKTEAEDEMLQRVYRHLGNSQAQLIKFKNEEGCPHCSMGVVGRTVASEIILPDDYMLRCFRNRQDADALMYHIFNGGKIALHHGIEKLLKGQVDLRDVEHKLDQLTRLQELQTSVRAYVAVSGIDKIKAEEDRIKREVEAIPEAERNFFSLDNLTQGFEPRSNDGRAEAAARSPINLEKAEVAPLIQPAAVVNEETHALATPALPVEEPVAAAPVLAVELPVVELPPVTPDESSIRTQPVMAVEPEMTVKELTAPIHQAEATSLTAEEPVTLEAKKPDEASAQTIAVVTPDTDLVRVIPATPALVVESPAEPDLITVETVIELPVATEPVSVSPPIPEEVPMLASGVPVFMAVLQGILEAEVKRNGLELSARFMKGRLSAPAIQALLDSTSVDAEKLMALRLAFGALRTEELEALYSMTVPDVQAHLDSVVVEQPLVGDLVEPKVVNIFAQTPAKTASAVETTPPGESFAEIMPARAKPKPRAKKVEDAPAVVEKPKARAFKSKLLSGTDESTTKKTSTGNVKSMAAARAQKSETPASAKPTTKASPKKPAKTNKEDPQE